MKRIRLADLPLIVKIGIAPVLALFMLAVTAGIAVYAQMQVTEQLQQAVHVDMANSLKMQRISERITEAHGRLYLLLTHQAGKIEPEKIDDQCKQLVADLLQIGVEVKEIEATAPENQKPQFEKLRKQVEETRSATDLVGGMMTADFTAAANFVAPYEDSYKQMVATLAALVKETQDATNASAAESETAAVRTSWLLAIESLITFLLVLGVAWVSAFNTRNDIIKIADTTEKLAGGDNGIDFTVLERKDEMGAIIRSLAVFRDNQINMIRMRQENEAAQAARAKEVAGVITSLGAGLDRLAACDLGYRLSESFPPEYQALQVDFNRTIAELESTLNVITKVTADIQAETGTAASGNGNQAATLQATGAALVSALEAFRENQQRVVRLREEHQAAQDAKAQEQAEVVAMLAAGLDHLAEGDLSYRITGTVPPEYRRLRDDFNVAIDKLNETLSNIRNVTSVIQSGSGDVNVAVDDLSKRTEHQAATLEETAAALDEITATVKSTAVGADNVRVSISAAREDAVSSGHIVSDAVKAMQEIKTSADQIGQIVGAIDEIAFQTNLLALNAGVEAARAGEAGRGFAVVATEVRELSHRTAKMAKEIKNLIGISSTKVHQGVELVGETGATLERIVSQIVSISDVVGQIASSAKEQSTGLEQINTAVNDMDAVTQQNAAMVQETTVASRSLAKQAEELVQLLGRFKVEGYRETLVSRVNKPHASAPVVPSAPVLKPVPAPVPPKPAPVLKAVPSTPVAEKTSAPTSAQMASAVLATRKLPKTDDTWEEF